MLSNQRWKPLRSESTESTMLFDGNQIVLRLVARLAGVSEVEELLEEKSRVVERLEVGSLIRDSFNQEFERIR